MKNITKVLLGFTLALVASVGLFATVSHMKNDPDPMGGIGDVRAAVIDPDPTGGIGDIHVKASLATDPDPIGGIGDVRLNDPDPTGGIGDVKLASDPDPIGGIGDSHIAPVHSVCVGCENDPCDNAFNCCRSDGSTVSDPDPNGGIGDDHITCNQNG